MLIMSHYIQINNNNTILWKWFKDSVFISNIKINFKILIYVKYIETLLFYNFHTFLS